MTNAERTLKALELFAGQVLTSKQIVALTAKEFPTVNITSIMPSDYVKGSKYSNLQFLEKAGSGYRVVAPETVKSTRARGVTLDAAYDSAMALLESATEKKPEVKEEIPSEDVTGDESEDDSELTDESLLEISSKD